MNTIISLLVLAAALALSGCETMGTSSLLTKQEAFPSLYSNSPKTILVLPPINRSTAADASSYYSATIAPPLTQNGYYVLPVTVTDKLLNEAGVSDGAQLANVPAQKYRELFGADAILFVTINKWDTNYNVLAGSVTVNLAYKLVSTATNETLWRYQGEMKVDTSGGGNNGLLAALLATAIQTATQDYLPIAQQVNARAMYTAPYGVYHPEHGIDSELRVVRPEVIEDPSDTFEQNKNLPQAN